MVELDDGSPGLLPCGQHYSHSPAEEKRWASLDFQVEAERQRKLFPSLIAYLKRKGKISAGPYPPVLDSYDTRREYGVKQHFAFLRNRLPRKKYLDEVSTYERALIDFLALPPCRREIGFPLLPSTIAGLIYVGNLATPHNGGRKRDPAVQQRNSRIAELKKAKISCYDICRTLDKEKCFIPPAWRKPGIQTWQQAYINNSNSVNVLVSKA